MNVNDHSPIANQHVFLIGRPPMGEFLGFMETQTLRSESDDKRTLSDEWRRANDHIEDLKVREAGYADHPQILPISPGLEELVTQLHADPSYQRSFSIVPSSVGMVELDRLVVYQKHINLEYVSQLRDYLSSSPSQEEIFKFCLLHDHPQAQIDMGRISQNGYIHTSQSTDLRFLGVRPLNHAQVSNVPQPGRSATAIALIVGYGSNLLNVLSVGGRLILHNGSHRAYTLRDMGIAHVPCVIQHISRPEELEVAATKELHRNTDRYLAEPRPSVLKDYFDPKLRKLVMVQKKKRQIKLSFRVEVIDVPAG